VTGGTAPASSATSLAAIVALQGLDVVADTIANKLHPDLEDARSVLIVGDPAFGLSDAPHADISARFAWFTARFEEAHKNLERLAPPPQAPALPPTVTPRVAIAGVAAALPTAIAAATGIAGLIGMFQTTYSVTGRDVNLNYTALAAVVAQKLIDLDKSRTVVIDGLLGLQDSPTFAKLGALLTARSDLQHLAQTRKATELDTISAEIDELKARITAATAAYDKARQSGNTGDAAHCLALIDEMRADLATKQSAAYLELEAEVASTTTLIASFDQYATAISAPPAGQAYPPIVAAALRDVVHDSDPPIDHVLYLAVPGAAGDMIQPSGGIITHHKVGLVGAVQGTYVLIDLAGAVRASGSIGRHSTATFDLETADLKLHGTSTPSKPPGIPGMPHS